MGWIARGTAALLATALLLAAPAGLQAAPDAAEVADLIRELGDEDPHVRGVAHRELVRLGSAPAPALLAAARGRDPRLADGALRVLRDLGPEAAEAAPGLAELAATADEERFLATVRTLVAIVPVLEDRLVLRLVGQLDGTDGPRQREALELLAAMQSVPPAASDALLAHLERGPNSLRPALVAALDAVGVDPSGRVLDLWATRRDPTSAWVPDVLAALGERAVWAATERLRHEEWQVREAAAEALGHLGPVSAAAVADLAIALEDDTGAVRRAAADALGSIGAPAELALPELLTLLEDPRRRARREAARALGRIGAALRQDPVDRLDAPGSVRETIDLGLDWLARHQSKDGRWDADGFDANCARDRCGGLGQSVYDPGLTGLALLAFLGAGEGPTSERHGEVVAKGLAHLRALQDGDGCVGPRTSQHFQYNHGYGALALVESARLGAGDREAARRALDFVLRSQNRGAGWRYGIRDGDNDTSVTATATLVLDAAVRAGLPVDPAALDGAVAWVEQVTEPELGRTGYQQRGGPPARTNEMLDRFPASASESLTAAGLVVRLAAGRTARTDPRIEQGAALLLQRLPRWDPGAGTIDFYYWHYGTRAMRGIGGRGWAQWRAALLAALPPHQRQDGDARGSWDPADPWAPEGGRIYSTTFPLLALIHAFQVEGAAPPPPRVLRPVIAALDATAADEQADADVRAAARDALEQIDGTWGRPGGEPEDARDRAAAPDPERPPPAIRLAKPTGNPLAYRTWLRRFARAAYFKDVRGATSTWDEGVRRTWVFPGKVTAAGPDGYRVRLDSDAHVDEQSRGARWGIGPGELGAALADPRLAPFVPVGTSVDVAIDLPHDRVQEAMKGPFPATLRIWRVRGRR